MGTKTGTTVRVGPWFDVGADAAWRIFGGQLPFWGYICPICRHLYAPEQAGLLSPDHVPSESRGGRRLVLTCDCNHRAGHGEQVDLLNREIPIRAFRGELGEPHPVTLSWKRSDGSIAASVQVRMHMESPGEPMSFVIVEEANDPAVVEELKRLMDAAVGRTDWAFVISFDRNRYHPVAARVAVLRDAYLAAFAVFGYRYILHPALDTVRRQLQQPREKIISRFMVTDPAPSEDVRTFYVVAKPELLRSVLVRIGSHWVYLPRPDSDRDLYADLLTRPDSELVTFQGAEWYWPTRPMHYMDCASRAQDLLDASSR